MAETFTGFGAVIKTTSATIPGPTNIEMASGITSRFMGS